MIMLDDNVNLSYPSDRFFMCGIKAFYSASQFFN
jgi:hypothetical protein